jgi:hypothetical protein
MKHAYQGVHCGHMLRLLGTLTHQCNGSLLVHEMANETKHSRLGILRAEHKAVIAVTQFIPTICAKTPKKKKQNLHHLLANVHICFLPNIRYASSRQEGVRHSTKRTS